MPQSSPQRGSVTTDLSAQRTIMVIDDSRAVRTIIEATFARLGIPVSAFPDGVSAIKALAQQEVDVPSLVLLDIGLPRMDGYEVAGLLRSNVAFEDTVVVMLTGRDGVIDRLRSKMVGAKGYIRKPFRVPQVVETVCGYLQIPTSTKRSDGE